MNKRRIFEVSLNLGSLGILFGFLASCGSGVSNEGAASTSYQQVERLARPALNEGLILSNHLLNAWNAAPPSADLTDAAADIRTEAAAVLGLINKFGTTASSSFTPPALATVVTGFLPDVMRIDTSRDVDPGTANYNSCLGATKAILCGGRKIKDDVMDVTLSYLVAGDPTGATIKDNVSFTSPVTHTVTDGFPYLGSPN